jgi:hypothetical protein
VQLSQESDAEAVKEKLIPDIRTIKYFIESPYLLLKRSYHGTMVLEIILFIARSFYNSEQL